MTRVRNQRTGQWIELPDDDGLVAHHRGRRLTPAEAQHQSQINMAVFDANAPTAKKRHFACYQCVNGKPATPYHKRSPGWKPFPTDPKINRFIILTFDDMGI
jgi:hypothetical protein